MAFLVNAAQAETLRIHLILSGSTPYYQEFAATLSKMLAENKIGVDVRVVELQASTAMLPDGTDKPDMIIPVGTKAAEFALSFRKSPLLAVMVPKNSLDALLDGKPLAHTKKFVSAIYLDQPWDRQLMFMKAILPKHNVIGMLYSPDTTIALPRLPHGMSINIKSVRSADALFDALENILSSSDVLLMIPDGNIYSSSNVRNILLTSYRHRVPMIGISQSYVNAGAIGAIFSTPEQLAKQAEKIISAFANNRTLPEPQYPESFSIALNQQVARSLEIELPSLQTILERMGQAGEGGR